MPFAAHLEPRGASLALLDPVPSSTTYSPPYTSSPSESLNTQEAVPSPLPQLKILHITSATHDMSKKNLNSYQRVHFLSRNAQLTILAKKGADFSVSAQEGTPIITAPLGGKLGLIIFSLFWLPTVGRKQKFDLVITEPSLVGIGGFWAKLTARMRWAVDIWDIPIRCHSESAIMKAKSWLTRKVFKFLYRFADLFIISILPNFELKEFDLPTEKMLTLKNAIWLEEISESTATERCEKVTVERKHFDILCMRSRYTADMGLDILAQAFLSLSEELEGICLTIVGIIPQEIRHQVADLEGMRNVRLCGFVDHDRLLDTIRAASVCVIPFRDVADLSQTYPIKVLEYLALGKPVIASRIAGLSAMIEDGRTGLLFRPGDWQDLADKIRKLYHNHQLRAALSANALASRGEFDCVAKNRVILDRLYQITGWKNLNN